MLGTYLIETTIMNEVIHTIHAAQATLAAHPEVMKHISTATAWLHEHVTTDNVKGLIATLKTLDWFYKKWKERQTKRTPPTDGTPHEIVDKEKAA
jgi:hypothetical protein